MITACASDCPLFMAMGRHRIFMTPGSVLQQRPTPGRELPFFSFFFWFLFGPWAAWLKCRLFYCPLATAAAGVDCSLSRVCLECRTNWLGAIGRERVAEDIYSPQRPWCKWPCGSESRQPNLRRISTRPLGEGFLFWTHPSGWQFTVLRPSDRPACSTASSHPSSATPPLPYIRPLPYIFHPA